MTRRIMLWCVLAAAASSAQTFEIRGSVTDPSLNLGVPGVDVTLYDAARNVVATAPTGSDGSFRFRLEHAGDYRIQAKEQGYLPEVAEASAAITAEKPSQEVRLSMTRPGEVTGRVIDGDGKPVSGMRVAVEPHAPAAYPAVAAAGRDRQPSPDAGIVTDKDGIFTASNLQPGDYFIRLMREVFFTGGLVKFTEDEVKGVDEDFGSTAVPVHVSSGTLVNVGNVESSRRVSYRAHVRVHTDGCAPDEKWTFTAIETSAGSESDLNLMFGGIPCSPELLIRRLKPGSYTFALWSGGTGDPEGKWALEPVEVRRGNVETDLTLYPAVEVNGKLIAADGAMLPPLNELRLGLQQFTVKNAPIVSESLPAADGKFQFRGVRWPRHQITLYGLSPQYYVKEIRCNGAPSLDGFVTFSPGSPQQIEIVIDDKPSSINGTVTENDQPVAQPSLLYARWPLPVDNAEAAKVIAGGAGDDTGRFQLAGLAPGEYRVVALPQNGRAGLDADASIRLLNSGEKVTLDPGGSQNLMLKVTYP